MAYLSARKDARQGAILPNPPMKYKLYQWRHEMHATYEQMCTTPASVIHEDLEMMSLESQFNQEAESKK